MTEGKASIVSIRVPSSEQYIAYLVQFGPVKCGRIPQHWTCPACGRTLFQIMRWTRRYRTYNPVPTDPYDWWLISLHSHHDHSGPERFERALVCDHCNSVDVSVKRRFAEMNKRFSFSPNEIKSIVQPRSHQGHILNYGKAQDIYRAVVYGTADDVA